MCIIKSPAIYLHKYFAHHKRVAVVVTINLIPLCLIQECKLYLEACNNSRIVIKIYYKTLPVWWLTRTAKIIACYLKEKTTRTCTVLASTCRFRFVTFSKHAHCSTTTCFAAWLMLPITPSTINYRIIESSM